MKAILDFIVDVLSQPAILVALIAFIGLVVQKKPASVITSGTIKTILGFLILSAGAGVVVQSLEPFGKIFQHAFGVQGVVPNNEAIISIALKKYGTTAALIMVFGNVSQYLNCTFYKFEIHLLNRPSYILYGSIFSYTLNCWPN
nr:PTS transporter subunit IIC [Staphylococcus coagulans]